MSEKLYALLFRLYPARFRAAWRDQALELIRDRARHERGLVPHLRLWLDLLADFAVSLPCTYARDHAALAPAAPTPPTGVPSFCMLEKQPIRSSAFFFGTVVSVVALAIVTVLLQHGGHVPILHPSQQAEAGGVTLDPWATGPASGGATGSGGADVIGDGATSPSQSASQSTTDAPLTTVILPHHPTVPLFDSAEKDRVIQGIIANLNQHYSDRSVAMTLSGALRLHNDLGHYRYVTDPAAFAALLTRQIRATSHDLHFEVVYSRTGLPEQPASTVPTDAYRAILLQAHCTFDKVDILPRNIGYLKLDSFPSPQVCGDTAIAAMKTLSRADTLIIDLRDNSGGSPEMVLFIAGWLFDQPAFFYTPRYDSAARMYTHSPMGGSALANKPVYILTSSRTWSAAEHFAWNLKMLHRATLVGETTAGATDAGVFHRIDDHFGVAMLESRVANPYPTPDWAVSGVRPDIPVPAAQALATAEKLAAEKLARQKLAKP